ncbi:DUF3597 domain-containing protein [Candidatus Schmidhempelia bombi]|uniref:DUF3597 domain-containing protein n=1 Tax=Candidatus Schmidhempelia bombi str. Bimp TaxID=1387197 RepID=A0AB94IEX3_9GAMM|nr:DUF3597 domain-containing protein [Candidatus Schmidhempelia bombi]TEA28061.1 DUF3597 domain-containing protein [Candidatus Schmidhempelia bombi str. Bimp]
MSIFKNIMSKIFPSAFASETDHKEQADKINDKNVTSDTTHEENSASQPQETTQATTAPATNKVDVVAILEEMQKKYPEKLNWHTSIVDLMKLLGLDSSLNARKQLAQELSYTGDMNDSAAMNIWLHKEIMRKIAENGGVLPESIKH